MKKLVLFIACTLILGTAANAQATKFGYIDSRELLSMMPEVKKADSALSLYAKTYQDQIEAMGKEYQKKGQEYQAGEKTMTEAMKEVKIREIQKLEQNIQETQQSAQDKVQKKREEIYAPILEKAEKAIKEVAKANNFDYIFDYTAGGLLYAKDGDNIMPLVKAKLGIK